jgi:hypothetical protein
VDIMRAGAFDRARPREPGVEDGEGLRSAARPLSSDASAKVRHGSIEEPDTSSESAKRAIWPGSTPKPDRADPPRSVIVEQA